MLSISICNNTARLSDSVITHMITDCIGLHSVLLPLLIHSYLTQAHGIIAIYNYIYITFLLELEELKMKNTKLQKGKNLFLFVCSCF